MKKLIESNIYVFKENMKLILNSAIDQICINETVSGKLENLLIKEYNKGIFEEIIEVDESVSDYNSIYSSRNVT